MRKFRQSIPRILGVFWFFLVACSEQNNSTIQGYIEGDYLYLAAPRAGYLETLAVERGSFVEAGNLVFSIQHEPENYALDQARARKDSASEKIENLKEPRRQAEIAAMEAELKARKASLRFSVLRLKRLSALREQGFASSDELDEARSARDLDAAEVEAAKKQLALYQTTLGRQAEIRGAQADLQAADALLRQKDWWLRAKSVSAPNRGQVTEVYYRPGEWVPADQPVLSFLPDDRRKIRFFMPENQIASIRPGQRIEAECDGCPTPIAARVNFIAPLAEYTPPVIYSRESRSKLVFRIEAIPAPADAQRLYPGLPVDVRILHEK